MDGNTAAMVLVFGLVGSKLMEQVVIYFFGKLTKESYVTKTECAGCEKQSDTAMEKMAAEISIIKGLLLVLAVKNDIPAEQLAKLTK